MPADAFALDDALAVIAHFAGRRIGVLGDVMLDRYLWGEVERISPEAPVPVVEVTRESASLGGAGNVAANLAALEATPLLVGLLGEDPEGHRLQADFARRGIEVRGLVTDLSRRTTVKTRVIAHQQQVVRADVEDRHDVSGEAERQLLECLERALSGAEALVVSDYGKGVVTRGVLERALERARRDGIHVCVDPKESHFEVYRGVSVITPNVHEAGRAFGRRIVDEESLKAAGWGLRDRLDARAVLITRGAQGMSLFERDGRYTYLPTVAREVFDVTGAGDTVVSVMALALAAGADFALAAHLANHAAGLVIREVGTATCTAEALRASLRSTRP
jgi:D-beta-D-heptose 7-phosphate kinase/D-beta-D-heptose 1-phosphate adenosyltransferase